MLLLTVALPSALYGHEIWRTSASTSESSALNSLEQQVVGLVNGTEAYDYDLELENIALSHPDFRSAGSLGANETANLIKAKFESFGLETWLESFKFWNWSLSGKPSLVIDVDGNRSTKADQVVIDSFQCEHYSWPTPLNGTFAPLVVLPLPAISSRSQIGQVPIGTSWDSINTTDKIVLVGREVRTHPNWNDPYAAKLSSQVPAAVIYMWWYPWDSFIPPFFSSSGGVPINGGYYWSNRIPVGFVNHDAGLFVNDSKTVHPNLAANLTIPSIISSNGTHYNVVGKIAGQDPSKMVIISSHYDTVMDAGFCDNGAGTAGVIELARVIAEAINRSYYQPQYTLLFVCFTGEELYLVGSAEFVKRHKNDMANIIAVIHSDCIGSRDLHVSRTPGSELNQTVTKAAQDLGIPISPEDPGGSDHESFMDPSLIDYWISSYWGVELNISDAPPVASSTMLISYPLFYSDFWSMGTPGWIHTAYDNSTTPNWVDLSHLENHIKVAALSVMRISPNAIPEFPPIAALALLMVITPFVCIVARKASRLRTG